MNFRILNYFLTVAHEKNITKAAEVLHITQPTLSRQLMQLEEDLGTKLFDRSQHKFALTPSGQFLVQRAQEILDMVEKNYARHPRPRAKPQRKHCLRRR